MGKNTGKYALAAVVLVGAMIFFANGGQFPQFNGQAPTGSITPNPTPNTTVVPGTGLKTGDQLTVTMNNRDALTEASLTEGTNVKTTLLNKKTGGGYNVVTTGSGQTYTLTAADNGMVSVGFETQASGQSYAFAVERTKAANAGIMQGCEYVDVELDGTKEWVCQFSTSHLTSQVALSGTKPDLAINAKYYNENTLSLNSPSDISSIGTTAGTTKFIEWIASGTAGDASYVSTVELKLNSTTTSKWDEGNSYITVGGTQYALSSLERSQDGTNTHYYLRFGNDLSKAKILEFSNTGIAKDYMTAKIVWNLSSGNVITTTLLIDSVNEVDGANGTQSDSVVNSA